MKKHEFRNKFNLGMLKMPNLKQMIFRVSGFGSHKVSRLEKQSDQNKGTPITRERSGADLPSFRLGSAS